MNTTVAAVAIGRNEGERLVSCLDSLQGKFAHIVYVDSGSTDSSIVEAIDRNVDVVNLDMSMPFSAARARNAGAVKLTGMVSKTIGKHIDYIQFIDGDCVLQDGWIETGKAFLDSNLNVAAVCGRNRERFPDSSIYNRLADIEWDTPIGQAKACGGIVMMRKQAFDAVDGFNPKMIAGEEPELCLRLRAAGWKIWRLDAEMTLHDANMMRLGQWWQRAKRSGYVYAEAVAMHGASPERYGVRELKHIIAWGLMLPLIIGLGSFLISPWMLLFIAAWPVQMLRRFLRGDHWLQAVFITLAKFPEAQGAVLFLWRRLMRVPSRLIEHK